MAEDKQRALAVRGDAAIAPRSNPQDDYERKFMPGKGMMLHRAKAKMPRVFTALMGLGAVGMAATALAGGGAIIGGLLGAGAMLLTWTSLSVLRVAVSEGTVHVQYGIFGPEIPVAAIEHVERFQYNWMRYGGYGIRRGWNGEWMYNVPGDGGNAVRIVWRDSKGRRKTTCIGTRDADTVYRAIVKARGVMQRALTE